MRQLGNEEKAALLLTADDDEENDHHEMTSSPSRTTSDCFPVVAKRPRTYQRHVTSSTHPVLCFALILGAFVFGCISGVVIMLYRLAQDAEHGPSTSNAYQLNTDVDLAIQTRLFESISKANFMNVNDSLESESNAANKLHQQWQSLSASLSHVNKFSYDITLSKYAPLTQWSGIQLLDSKNENELLKADRSATDDFVSFSSLTKSGTVDGSAIFYVNYGRQEDFAYLLQKNQITFNEPGKSIVFMRRQSTVLSQTEQIHQAIYYGFGALVLFDDRENQQVTTTNHRQPLFREWARYRDAQERENFLDDVMKTSNHSIAVLVLSYEDVQRIFGSLQPDSNQWSSCPSQWHDKPTPMKIGGTLTSIKLRLTVNMQEVKAQLPVVISSIRGTMDAERFVMVGFQLSSSQQNRIVNEIIQAYTNQVKNGWSPKRSILFCAWSGLGYDQYAVRRWISDNSRLINSNLIAYLDLGNGIVGNSTLNLHGSALLGQVAYRAANYVPSPLPHNHTCHHRGMSTTTTTTAMMMSQEGNHHHEHSRKRRDGDHEHHMETDEQAETKCEPHKLLDEWIRASHNQSLGIVQSVDTESAAALFQLQYGVPSILIEMTDEQAVTNETFYVRRTPVFVRQTIEPETLVAYAQFISELLRQLVDEPLIPFNLTNYAEQMDQLTSQYLEHFQKGYGSLASHIGYPTEFSKAVNDLTKSIRQVQSRIDRISKKDYISLQSLNRQLIEFERLFISNDRLRWMNSADKTYKHILFGPAFGLSNTAVPFPSLSNVLYGIPGDPPEQICDTATFFWSRMKEHISLIHRTLNGFDGLLSKDN